AGDTPSPDACRGPAGRFVADSLAGAPSGSSIAPSAPPTASTDRPPRPAGLRRAESATSGATRARHAVAGRLPGARRALRGRFARRPPRPGLGGPAAAVHLRQYRPMGCTAFSIVLRSPRNGATPIEGNGT